MLWGITALFVLTTAGGMYAYDAITQGATAAGAIDWLGTPATQIIPLAALVVAYLSIAGERESGSLKILLGLPHTRRDVVVGKLVGRTAVVALATFVSFLAGAGVLLVNYQTVPVADFVILAGLTLLFATAFVGIAVGFSSLASTRSRAMAGAIGLFFLFQFIWDFVPLGIYYVVEGHLPNMLGGGLPAWYFLVQFLSPKNAYSTLSTYLMNPDATTQVETVLGGDLPFYLDTPFLFVILLAWLVVPVTVGYLRFRNADLS
jgi:ABC-2 type transport system permease protein